MTMNDILDHVATLTGALVLRPQPGDGSPEISWGDAFFYCSPDGTVPPGQPYATIVTKDYPGEPSSGLDRPEAFRLNISVSATEFHRLTGSTPKEAPSRIYDTSTPDTWFPHPAYGRAGWLSVVNPGPRTAETALHLLTTAHETARARRARHPEPSPGA